MPSGSMQYEKHIIELKNDKVALHRFCQINPGIPVLLMHGSIENGKIFFTKNGKGLAPFLCQNGYDVYIPDMRGKGESEPKVDASNKHSQTDQITIDIPAYLERIEKLRPFTQIHFGAHSWGGVLLLAYLARHEDNRIRSLVFFGVKRKIGIRSIRKYFLIDLGWKRLGQIAVRKKGYFPAKDWKIGADNEPENFYRETNNWLTNDQWVDANDNFNYGSTLRNTSLPPILSIVGIRDRVLGHYSDAQMLLNEIGSTENSKLLIIGKKYGNKLNYGHIDMLTNSKAPDDHFQEAVNWFKINELVPE